MHKHIGTVSGRSSGTAIDTSARALEHARRSRSFYRLTFVLWAIAVIIAAGFVTATAVREQQRDLDDAVRALRASFEDRARTNNAVLQGFATLLEAPGAIDPARLTRYARGVLSRFPEVQRLELARELRAGDRPGFIARHGNDPGFAAGLRQHPPGGDESTFPLVFQEPVAGDGAGPGADVGAAPALRAALLRSREVVDMVASDPFVQATGAVAYGMFQPVIRHAASGEDPTALFGGRLTALLVVRADSIFDIEALARRGDRVLVRPASVAANAVVPLLDLAPAAAAWSPLPRLRAQARVENVGQPYVIVAERQVGWRHFDRLALAVVVVVAALALALIEILRRRQAIAAAALEANEARLRALFETANAGIFQADAEGILRLVNSRLCEMFGYTEAELIGQHYADLVHADARADAQRRYDELVSGAIQTSDVERHYQRRDGSEFWGVASGRRQIDSQGRPAGISAIIIDVSDRRRAEEALRRERDFADRLIRTAPVLILLLDVAGRIHHVNPFFTRVTGYRLEDVQGRDWFSTFVTDADRAAAHTDFQTTLGGGARTGVGRVIRINTRSGGGRDVQWHAEAVRDEQGKVVSLLAIGVDVSERVRAEQARRESEERLSFMLRSSSDILYLIGANGVPRYVSTVVEKITGYTADELRTPIRGYIHDEDWPRVRDAWRRLLANPELLVRVEYRHRRKQGGYVWLEAIAQNFLDREAIGAVAVNARDIDERKDIEARLLEARVAAEAATQAKSDFLANMSHEIRTPMNAILGLGYLLELTALQPRQRDYVSKMIGSTRSLQAIVDDILDFSKIEAGHLEIEQTPFDLDEILDELACVVGVAAEGKAIEINFIVASGVPPRLVGDPLRTEQVLSNLLSNAAKFTTSGEIDLRIDAVGVADGSMRLRFCVSDTGCGIEPALREHLFAPFTQADASTTRRHGGTGLGLAICRRLVELMGGEIEVDSVPGRGSRFSFTVAFGRAGDDEVPDAGARPPLPARRVLLAVPHPTTRQVLIDLVASIGGTARAVASSKAAVAELGGAEAYDVVIVDAGLADLEPLRAALATPAAGRDPLPVLLVAADWVRGVDDDLLPGIVGRILKPATRRSLLDALGGGAAAARAAGEDARPLPLAGRRVLVVEDSPVNRQVAEEILESYGAVAECVSDGAQAIARLTAVGAPIDVVLMDLQMPLMDGFEATIRIRRHEGLAGLPIIAMTANVLATTIERCRSIGVDHFIAKPVQPDVLCAAICRVLATALPPPRELVVDSDFPVDLPGIDVADARLRMLGRSDLLRRMLGAYADSYGDYAERINDALAAGDAAGAAALVHDLIGAAATIGARSLAASARELENALRTATGHAAALAALQAAAAELSQTIAGVVAGADQ